MKIIRVGFKKILVLNFLYICGCSSMLYEMQPYYDKNKFESDFEKHCNVKKNESVNWLFRNYVDDFGDKTKNKYLTNAQKFKGFFSNSATEKSELGVRFLIERQEISFYLYEYNGDNPSKTIGGSWSIKIKEKSGKEYELGLRFYENRFFIGRVDVNSINYSAWSDWDTDRDMGARLFHILMARNDELKVYIEDSERYNNYVFKMSSRGYCRAYRNLY